MSHRLKNKWVVLALATFCCLLWGSAYPCVKIGYSLFGIETTGAKILFAGYRFTLAGVITFLMAAFIFPKMGNSQKG